LSAKSSQPKGRTIAATVSQKVLLLQNSLSLILSMLFVYSNAGAIQITGL